MYTDKNGHLILSAIIIGAVVGGAISSDISLYSEAKEAGGISNMTATDWTSVGISTVVGAASGAVAATGLGAAVQAGITAGICGLGNALDQGVNKAFNNIDPWTVIGDASIGALASVAGGAVGNKFDSRMKTTFQKGSKKIATTLGKEIERLEARAAEKFCIGRGMEMVSRSCSSYYKAATKALVGRNTLVNTFRSVSSGIGSIVGAPMGIAYKSIKNKVEGIFS